MNMSSSLLSRGEREGGSVLYSESLFQEKNFTVLQVQTHVIAASVTQVYMICATYLFTEVNIIHAHIWSP